MSRFLARVERHRCREAEIAEPRLAPRAAAGDEDRLRYIPVIGGRGSRGGAIPGSKPGERLR